jgi:hypothetical protein
MRSLRRRGWRAAVAMAAAFLVPAVAGAGAAGQPSSAPQRAKQDAEFAVRWDPAQGGPRDARAAARALGWRVRREESLRVRYYDAATPLADVPPGAQVVLRERRRKQGVELTLKYRSERAMTALPALDRWACPLGRKAEVKDEVDVSFDASASPGRAYSRSCSLERVADAAAVAARLGARPQPCESDVLRLRADPFKIEEWHLPDGGRLIEVSRNGRDSEKAAARFAREVVLELTSRLGAKPIASSKTAGSGCAR